MHFIDYLSVVLLSYLVLCVYVLGLNADDGCFVLLMDKRFFHQAGFELYNWYFACPSADDDALAFFSMKRCGLDVIQDAQRTMSLQSVFRFATSSTCRYKYLISQFECDANNVDSCKKCDSCTNPLTLNDQQQLCGGLLKVTMETIRKWWTMLLSEKCFLCHRFGCDKHAAGCTQWSVGTNKNVQRCVMCRNTRQDHTDKSNFNRYSDCCYIRNKNVCGVCMHALDGQFVSGLVDCVVNVQYGSHVQLCNTRLRGSPSGSTPFYRKDAARSFYLTLLDKLSTGPNSVYEVFSEFDRDGSTLSSDLVWLSRDWWCTWESRNLQQEDLSDAVYKQLMCRMQKVENWHE